jgi:molybdate transport system ATP-binding protein
LEAAAVADGLRLRLRQDGPIALDVALAIAPGEALGLVGPSGAGKTTVLRAIAGFQTPTEGSIACNGESWFDSSRGLAVAARERHAGFVFQSYALFPRMTAAANVAEAMLELPRAERRERAAALLRQMHLDDLGDRLPSQLSGGQQQRVALARALAREPKVLLLDEPFSAVDQPTRRALQATLAEIRAANPIPIVLVSHDVQDIARCVDRLCFMQKGSTVEEGPVADLLGNPGSRLARWLRGDDQGA